MSKPGSLSRTALLFSLLLGIFALVPLQSIAMASSAKDGSVSSADLIWNASRYDEKTVIYSGEVIGEVLKRGDYAWITVNDDHYSTRPRREHQELKGVNSGVNIHCRYEMVQDIKLVGSFNARGDRVRVEGTFYMSSAEHGGDLMIEAEKLEIIQKGHRLRGENIAIELTVALVLGIIVLALGTYWLINFGSNT